MGEGTTGLSDAEELLDGAEHEASDAEEPAPPEIERDIEALRAELGDLVRELDRRRHEMFDVRLQVRRHFGAIAALGAALTLLALGGRALSVSRRRRSAPL